MLRHSAMGPIVALAMIASLAGRAIAQSPAPVVTSPTVPPDVSIPAGFGGDPIAFFDDYSWRAFIAMVWPAQSGARGVPDTTKSVDGAGPRVFETYKTLDETFHPGGVPPTPWEQFDPPQFNACGLQGAWGDMTLGSFNKFGSLGEAGFGTLVGPLIAQNKTYVRYLTSYNKVEFNNILDRKWYIKANLPVAPAVATFDVGALDVKSSWIDMTGIANPGRFYTRMANVLEPTTGTCSSIQVGLIGIHIVQKTPTRPQWIWTSFEHVDNVPGDVNGGHGPFTFNDGTGTAMPASNPYPLDRVLTPPVPPAFNVTRVMPINPSTVATNAAYQAALAPNSIWKNYRLVMTQWPLVPSSPGTNGLPANTFPGLGATSAFANTTLETFDQRSIFTGCMACHNSTRQPTDFVWSLNDHAFTGAITSHAILMKNPAFRELRELLELNKNHPEQLERLDPKR